MISSANLAQKSSEYNYFLLNPVEHFGLVPEIFRTNFPFTQVMEVLPTTFGTVAVLALTLLVVDSLLFSCTNFTLSVGEEKVNPSALR